MAARLRALGVAAEKIKVISNWADRDLITPLAPEENKFRKEWVPDGRFVVGYAGNLGRAHDIDTILSADDPATEARDEVVVRRRRKDHVRVRWCGGEACETRAEALKRKLTNFRMRPYQPKERLGETLGVADVHLVSLDPKLEGLIVPSKFYGIAAAGRPTIFVGAKEGEIARLLEENGERLSLSRKADLRRCSLVSKVLTLFMSMPALATVDATGGKHINEAWGREADYCCLGPCTLHLDWSSR